MESIIEDKKSHYNLETKKEIYSYKGLSIIDHSLIMLKGII